MEHGLILLFSLRHLSLKISRIIHQTVSRTTDKGTLYAFETKNRKWFPILIAGFLFCSFCFVLIRPQISGTAAKLGQPNAYHHCTLLVNSNKLHLSESLVKDQVRNGDDHGSQNNYYIDGNWLSQVVTTVHRFEGVYPTQCGVDGMIVRRHVDCWLIFRHFIVPDSSIGALLVEVWYPHMLILCIDTTSLGRSLLESKAVAKWFILIGIRWCAWIKSIYSEDYLEVGKLWTEFPD